MLTRDLARTLTKAEPGAKAVYGRAVTIDDDMTRAMDALFAFATSNADGLAAQKSRCLETVCKAAGGGTAKSVQPLGESELLHTLRLIDQRLRALEGK